MTAGFNWLPVPHKAPFESGTKPGQWKTGKKVFRLKLANIPGINTAREWQRGFRVHDELGTFHNRTYRETNRIAPTGVLAFRLFSHDR
ncbi:MAG: hypothetical protein OXC54_03210 [Rhodospirillaceae bacterium]|nr:hypothetical protein [Rhodospirillaceae bacterium]